MHDEFDHFKAPFGTRSRSVPYSLGPVDPDPFQSDKKMTQKKVLDFLIEGLEASSVTGSPS
jgi:hypothetical protein